MKTAAELSINMKQFNAKWQDYSDNVMLSEVIRANAGKFFTLDSRAYVQWLNEFNIFYTLTH